MAVHTKSGGRIALALAAVAAIAGAPRPMLANSGGITGRSGKQGPTCTACHGGGVTPDVRFDGPTQVRVGDTVSLRFEVHAKVPNQRAAGFNVAVSRGTLALMDGEGERLVARVNELTHLGPKLTDDTGVAGWTFLWTAPDSPGPATIYGAGNSVNLNGQSSGDRSNTTTLEIDVVETIETETPTPTATEPPPTPTPTEAATPTATGTVTPTFAPGPCVGDCNNSGKVSVNEVVSGVNIALGNTTLDNCAGFDVNSDGRVSVNELIAAVAAVLSSCVPLHG